MKSRENFTNSNTLWDASKTRNRMGYYYNTKDTVKNVSLVTSRVEKPSFEAMANNMDVYKACRASKA